MLQNWKKKIAAWYSGEFIVHENDSNSALLFIGGNYRRHRTAQIARVLISFWLKYWQWLIGIVVAIIAIAIKATK